MLTKDSALETLASFKQDHSQEYGIEEIGLFGSYARDEAHEDSDVDVYIKLKKSNLFKLSRIRIELEERLGKHVDIVEVRNSMNSYLKKHIDLEAVSA